MMREDQEMLQKLHYLFSGCVEVTMENRALAESKVS